MPIKHDQSYLAENIQGLAGDDHNKESPDKSKGYCHEYDDRVTEALKLCRKNKVNQDNGKNKCKEKARCTFNEVF